MKRVRKCVICGETNPEQSYYSESGVHDEDVPVICEFCYLNLSKVDEE